MRLECLFQCQKVWQELWDSNKEDFKIWRDRQILVIYQAMLSELNLMQKFVSPEEKVFSFFFVSYYHMLSLEIPFKPLHELKGSQKCSDFV